MIDQFISVIVAIFPALIGLSIWAFEYRVARAVGTRMKPVWTKLDATESDLTRHKMENAIRFTELDSNQKHAKDQFDKMETKLDDIDRKIDARHSELNLRLDKYFNGDKSK